MLGYDTPRIYFAVPDHYTIGREFDTLGEALDYAQSTVKPHDGFDGFTRAFVNVRIADREGDRPVHSIEVFVDGYEHVPEGKGGIAERSPDRHVPYVARV